MVIDCCLCFFIYFVGYITGNSRVICLESDNESESGSGRVDLGQNESVHSGSDDEKDSEWDFRIGKLGIYWELERIWLCV